MGKKGTIIYITYIKAIIIDELETLIEHQRSSTVEDLCRTYMLSEFDWNYVQHYYYYHYETGEFFSFCTLIRSNKIYNHNATYIFLMIF